MNYSHLFSYFYLLQWLKYPSSVVGLFHGPTKLPNVTMANAMTDIPKHIYITPSNVIIGESPLTNAYCKKLDKPKAVQKIPYELDPITWPNTICKNVGADTRNPPMHMPLRRIKKRYAPELTTVNLMIEKIMICIIKLSVITNR